MAIRLYRHGTGDGGELVVSYQAAYMAALLHPPTHPSRWMHYFTSVRIPPPRAVLYKRRIQTAAGGDGGAIDTDSTSSTPARAPSSSKKTSRKEKQRQHQRLREREEEQQLMLKASLVETAGEDDGGGGDDELPQVVFDRILRRIVFTVGAPMASGIALLNVYDALKRGRGVDVPPWVPLLTILVAFGTSALGIAYGTLSASWDPDMEGSLLGIDEARTNWPVLWKEEIEKESKK